MQAIILAVTVRISYTNSVTTERANPVLRRIKRIKTKPVKRTDPTLSAISRGMSISHRLLVAAKTRKQRQDAMNSMKTFLSAYNDHLFLRVRQVIDKAERLQSWDFMKGCYSQAVEVYAVASMAYEVFSNPIMTDKLFDALATFLHKNYADITPFCVERWNLNRGIFSAGTGSHFSNPEKFPDLIPYYNRLQAHYEAEAKERERTRTKNKPRLLRKASNGGQSKRQSGTRKTLRRPR